MVERQAPLLELYKCDLIGKRRLVAQSPVGDHQDKQNKLDSYLTSSNDSYFQHLEIK